MNLNEEINRVRVMMGLTEHFESHIYDMILDLYNEVGEGGMSEDELMYLKSGGESDIPERFMDGRGEKKTAHSFFREPEPGSDDDMVFESVDDIKKTINNLHGLSKEFKEIACNYVKSGTRAGKGKVSGLSLHKDLKKKIEVNELPSGFDMGIDKNGYYVHTHRARSKSHMNPGNISIKEIKFIDSTG